MSTPVSPRPNRARLGILLSTVEADRRVAGVSIAGRAVRVLAASGMTEVWIVAATGRILAAATSEDLGRLCDASLVTLLTEEEASARLATIQPADVVVTTTSHVITASAVSEFEAADTPLATSDDLPVLWHPVAGKLAPPDSGNSIAITLVPANRRAHWKLVQTGGKPQDGIVSRLINRRISQPISRVLLHLPWIRPGHATILTAGFAVAMAVCLFTGTQAGLIAGALLFQAASIIDGVDGEIARLTFRSSARGASLDSSVDAATNIAFLVGLAFNLSWQGSPFAPWLGLWSVGAVAAGLWLIGRQTVVGGQPLGFDLIKNRVDPSGASWFARLIMRAAIAISSRDTFAFLFAVLIVSGLAMTSLVIFAGLTAIWIVVVLINTVFAASSRARDQRTPPQLADV